MRAQRVEENLEEYIWLCFFMVILLSYQMITEKYYYPYSLGHLCMVTTLALIISWLCNIYSVLVSAHAKASKSLIFNAKAPLPFLCMTSFKSTTLWFVHVLVLGYQSDTVASKSALSKHYTLSTSCSVFNNDYLLWDGFVNYTNNVLYFHCWSPWTH